MTEVAKAQVKTLKALSKKEVFALYCRTCLGRVHNAKCSELRKDWMVYDIIKARHGVVAADAVA